jgi:hypothetical protein
LTVFEVKRQKQKLFLDQLPHLTASGTSGAFIEMPYPSSVTLGKFDEFTLFQLTKNQGFTPV